MRNRAIDTLRKQRQRDDVAERYQREQEVLTWLAEGLVNREIGERLGISPRTVARHRENIMRKLGLHSRTELVKYAIRIGMIDIEDD